MKPKNKKTTICISWGTKYEFRTFARYERETDESVLKLMIEKMRGGC